VTAAVVQRYGATAFSVGQTRSTARSSTAPRSGAAAQDVLIVAPLLTSPVQPGAYVTVIGEVVKFDPTVVAARMKDAAPPPDVAAKYTGKPAVLATSVINQSMTDLAKKLPPPMTPSEIELNRAMKQISPAFTALRQAVTASNTSDARDQATALANGFTAAAAFWKTQPHPEAIQWTEDARTLADEIAMLAAKPDLSSQAAADLLQLPQPVPHAIGRWVVPVQGRCGEVSALELNVATPATAPPSSSSTPPRACGCRVPRSCR
jgi:hypothetical protein